MQINLALMGAISCLLLACGGGDETPPDSDGLAAGASGAGGAAENASTAGGTDARSPLPASGLCDAPAPRVVLTGTAASSLSADKDFVYFIDPDAGPSYLAGNTGVVKRVAINSGEVTTLFEPVQGHYIRQMRLSGSELYLFMLDTTSPEDGGFVFRLPVTGGTPTLLGPKGTGGYNIDRPSLAAVGERSVYMVGSSRQGLYEITKADGSERKVVEADGISRPQLLGDTLWYATREGAGDIYRLDTSVAGAEPELAVAGGCGGGSVVNGSTYLVTERGILCGGLLSVSLLPLAGGTKEPFWSPPLDLAGGEISPAHLDGDTAYIVSGRFGAKLSVSDPRAKFFSCEGLTLDAVTTNASSLIWGRGGFSPGFPTNQIVAPCSFSEIVITPR